MTRPRTFIARSLLAMAGIAVTYMYGLLSMPCMGYLDVEDYCPPKTNYSDNSGFVDVTSSLLPLSCVCHWPDGSTKEFVPWYVNPLLIAGPIAWMACIVLAVRAQVLIERNEAFDDENKDNAADLYAQADHQVEEGVRQVDQHPRRGSGSVFLQIFGTSVLVIVLTLMLVFLVMISLVFWILKAIQP